MGCHCFVRTAGHKIYINQKVRVIAQIRVKARQTSLAEIRQIASQNRQKCLTDTVLLKAIRKK
jgi:hypothetical protein